MRKVIYRFSFVLILTIMCVDNSHGAWWQGNAPSSSSISVPETHPIDPPSVSSGPGRRWRGDDGRQGREKPREERGFFQGMLDKWEESKHERKRQEEVRRVKEESARISSRLSTQVPPSTMKLTPGGTPFFNAAPTDSSYEIAAGPISGIRTPADQIPRENLRRAAAILAPIVEAMKSGKSLSDEDLYFLANESAQAMEGAPLAVEVQSLPYGREEDTRRIVIQSQELGRAQIEAEMAITERLKVEEQLVKVQEAITQGKGDKSSLLGEREKILRIYKDAYAKESEKKEEVRKITRIIWVPPDAP